MGAQIRLKRIIEDLKAEGWVLCYKTYIWKSMFKMQFKL